VSPPPVADGNGDPIASASDAAGARRAAQRGMVALESGSIEQARREFELALSIDRRNVTAMGGMAEVAFERGRMEEVVHFAAKATRYSPKTLKYWILLGDASSRLNRGAEALAAYQRALALAPGDPSITNRIATARARMGGGSPPPPR
jgi:tetratricopeptide (TPR) repeat protein